MTDQEHWRKLAQEQRDRATYLEGRGEYGGVHRTRAALYDRTVDAIDLSRQHGEPYCACHLQPLRKMC